MSVRSSFSIRSDVGQDHRLKEQLASLVHEDDISRISIDDGLNILRQFIKPTDLYNTLIRTTMEYYRMPALQKMASPEQCINTVFMWIDKYAPLLYAGNMSDTPFRGVDIVHGIHLYDSKWIDIILMDVNTTDTVIFSFMKRLIETLDCIDAVAFAKLKLTHNKVIFTMSVREELHWNLDKVDMRKLYHSIIPLVVFEEPVLLNDFSDSDNDADEYFDESDDYEHEDGIDPEKSTQYSDKDAGKDFPSESRSEIEEHSDTQSESDINESDAETEDSVEDPVETEDSVKDPVETEDSVKDPVETEDSVKDSVETVDSVTSTEEHKVDIEEFARQIKRPSANSRRRVPL